MNSNQLHQARVIALGALVALVLGSYAIARPCIDSLYLSYYSPDTLPWAWLSMAFLTACSIGVYNHYNTRFSLLTLFGAVSILSSISLIALLLGIKAQIPATVFLLYVWKEVYIVLLVEIFWSFADVLFSIENAKKTYGLLLAIGSVGGFIGHTFIGYFGSYVGTFNALWLLLPIFLLCFIISIYVSKITADRLPNSIKKAKHHWGDSLKIVWNSKYLVPLTFLVGILQLAVTFIDYRYSAALQEAFNLTDSRTEVIGKVHMVIDVFSLSLQLTTAPILRFAGVSSTLLLIPIIVGSTLIAYVLFPRLLTLTLSVKVVIKSFDYSIFRAAKEILYIPLSRMEKTQGKAVIDILIYRVSKGLSSLLLLLLVGMGLNDYLMHITVIFILLWFLFTYIIAKRYRSIVSFDDEVFMRKKR